MLDQSQGILRAAGRVCAGLSAAWVIAAAGSIASGTLVAGWNFNDENLVVDHGSGTMTHTWTTLSYGSAVPAQATTVNAVSGDGSGFGSFFQVSGSSPIGNYQQWQVDLSAGKGFKDLILTLAWRDGGGTYDVKYSTDGSSFTTFSTGHAPASSWPVLTADFSTVPALDTQPTVFIRLERATGNDWAAGMRLENIQFNATLIPEPSTMFLFGLGGWLLWTWRRKS